ncbi:hypothetical protein D3C80_1779260 [compost metagenome]
MLQAFRPVIFSPVKPGEQQLAVELGPVFPLNHLNFRNEFHLFQLSDSRKFCRQVNAFINIKPQAVGLVKHGKCPPSWHNLTPRQAQSISPKCYSTHVYASSRKA